MGKITTVHKGGMLFESEMGKHKLTIEGPEEWGGKDRGPMPPQIFMASIGSCVGVLVAHFCEQHELNTEGLSVDVDYDVAQSPTRFKNINVTVDLPNAECDDDCTRKALKHVAEHCPVHETIVTIDEIQFNIKTKN